MNVNYNYSEIRLTKYNFIKNIDHKAFQKKKENIDHNSGICFVLFFVFCFFFFCFLGEILIQAYNYKFQNIQSTSIKLKKVKVLPLNEMEKTTNASCEY